jgi:NhaP-type Na+/H+ or K+/H+ antiporter
VTGRTTGLLALAGAATAVLILLAAFGVFERPEIVFAAMLSVLGTALTAYLGLELYERKRDDERDAAARTEEERKRRVLVALRAEVFETIQANAAQYGPETGPAALKRWQDEVQAAEAPQSGMPEAVVIREAVVFEGVKREIADLPAEVIPAVLRFYTADEFASELLFAISDGKFDDVTQKRRLGMLDSLFSLGRNALKEGIAAFHVLDRSIPAAGEPADEMRAAVGALEATLADDDGWKADHD